MLWFVLHTALRRVLELVLLRCRSHECKDLEIVVLRHELQVLRRQVVGCVNLIGSGSKAVLVDEPSGVQKLGRLEGA